MEDFPLLNRFLAQFTRVVTTPHVLTEVSTLALRLPDTLHAEFRSLLRLAAENWTEKFRPARSITAEPAFFQFGLTDTAISLLAPSRYLVLTDDLPLAGLLQKRGVDVVNFNHIRTEAWTRPS